MNLPFLVFLLVLVFTFLLRMPIPLGFFASTCSYLLLAGFDVSIATESIVTNLYSKYIVMAVPLFVFTANIMNNGTITERVFKFANALVGRAYGGLAHVNVIASLIFSGMTGSAIADASGLGLMELEAMRREGYDDGFTTAITAASATIGPIFPPSIPMVFYSMLSGASIGALFLGGMIPGLLMAVALMLYISIIAKRRNFPRSAGYTFSQFLQLTLNASFALLTPVILLGGIYSGVFTPTEAGAVAAFYAILVSFIVYRTLGPAELLRVILETVKTTGRISIIVGTSFGISFVISREGIPRLVAELMLGITENKIIFLLLTNVLFIILGMFINVSTIQLVFIPIMLPSLQAFGIDLVHFGVVIVLNMMIGLSTPPYGGLLFVVNAISGCPLSRTIRELLPMLLVLIVVLLIITYFPGVVLFLPRLVGN
jgi:tripartite ATP-independent transporter DctM subunit